MKLSKGCCIGALALLLGTITSLAFAGNDRYIVQFKDKGSKGGKSDLSAAGARVMLNLNSINAVAAEIPQQALAGLSNNPNIDYIEADPKRWPMSLRTAEVTSLWGISAVQADQLSSAGGKSICIIDSGYDLGHPDLPAGGNVSGSSGSAGPWDQDGYGHGTHVAGTIAALGGNGRGVFGVLPDDSEDLHIVRVFDDAGGFSYASGLVAALEDCEQAGAEVINMSLGGSFKSRSEDRAFAAAEDRGVLSIAAAGNDGNNRHSYPASYNSVISVAAVDEFLGHADFSQTTSKVELAGPGVHVLSTVPEGSGSEASASVGGSDFIGDAMDGAATGSASGNLIDCGLATSDCAAAGGQICLIQRGDISFADKVLACESGGGGAAIIYNNVPGPLLGTLGEFSSAIPAIGVSDTDGAAMLAGLGNGASVSVVVSDYAFFDGTSMATPHVAGVASLVWGMHPSCTNLEIRSALTASALDLGEAGRDDLYGHGLVQAQDADDYLTANPCGGGGGGGGGDGGDGGDGGNGGKDKPCNPNKPGCN
jgi:subtilisin family serine protease